MKRFVTIVLLLAVSVGFIFANGQGEGDAGEGVTYQDGIYFAQEDGFNERTGWKYMATLEVEDGMIVDVEWNGANAEAGPDKVTVSESGDYGMVANGGAQSEWHVQAAIAEEYLIDLQDPTAMDLDSDGYTDAVSGVSIHIHELRDLAVKALEQGPVGYGPYEDGAYSAEQPEFSHGWKERVDLTVVSGYIVAAYWNPVSEEGDSNKYEASKAGEYGMVERGGAQAPFWEQADKVEAKLIETQDPTAISWDDDGATDAISGVSITVDSFFELAEEALEDAQ